MHQSLLSSTPQSPDPSDLSRGCSKLTTNSDGRPETPQEALFWALQVAGVPELLFHFPIKIP